MCKKTLPQSLKTVELTSSAAYILTRKITTFVNILQRHKSDKVKCTLKKIKDKKFWVI